MATFFVARHGQTLLNALGRAQGWCDSPLTAEGEDAASALGRSLATVPLYAAYASDTMRATQTARVCLEAAGQESCPVVEDARLREWCLGSMEAESNDVFARQVSEWIGPPNSLDDMNRRLPEVAEAIRAHDETGTAASFQSIASRTMEFLQHAARRHGRDANVLVVTHAFLIKTMMFLIDPDMLSDSGRIGNGSFVRIVANGDDYRIVQSD